MAFYFLCENNLEAKAMERDGMIIAENGNIDKSIEIFTQVRL